MTGKVVRVYLLLNFIGDHPTGRPSRFTAETILTTIIVALPLSRKVKGTPNSKMHAGCGREEKEGSAWPPFTFAHAVP